MFADLLGGFETSLHYVNYTFGKIYLLKKFCEVVCSTCYAFRRLENIGVSASDGEGEHPKRNHSGEVKGGYTCTNSQWHAERVSINTF
jgi:hypothetical protein